MGAGASSFDLAAAGVWANTRENIESYSAEDVARIMERFGGSDYASTIAASIRAEKIDGKALLQLTDGQIDRLIEQTCYNTINEQVSRHREALRTILRPLRDSSVATRLVGGTSAEATEGPSEGERKEAVDCEFLFVIRKAAQEAKYTSVEAYLRQLFVQNGPEGPERLDSAAADRDVLVNVNDFERKIGAVNLGTNLGGVKISESSLQAVTEQYCDAYGRISIARLARMSEDESPETGKTPSTTQISAAIRPTGATTTTTTTTTAEDGLPRSKMSSNSGRRARLLTATGRPVTHDSQALLALFKEQHTMDLEDLDSAEHSRVALTQRTQALQRQRQRESQLFDQDPFAAAATTTAAGAAGAAAARGTGFGDGHLSGFRMSETTGMLVKEAPIVLGGISAFHLKMER
jgi:hypothetical protein